MMPTPRQMTKTPCIATIHPIGSETTAFVTASSTSTLPNDDGDQKKNGHNDRDDVDNDNCTPVRNKDGVRSNTIEGSAVERRYKLPHTKR